jgi:hypothetical protein
MNPLEMMKKAMAEKEAKKGKKPFKKKMVEGSAAEEKMESPEEEMTEVKAGKGDKEDKFKGKK